MGSVMGGRVRVSLPLAFPLGFGPFHGVFPCLLGAGGLLSSKGKGRDCEYDDNHTKLELTPEHVPRKVAETVEKQVEDIIKESSTPGNSNAQKFQAFNDTEESGDFERAKAADLDILDASDM